MTPPPISTPQLLGQCDDMLALLETEDEALKLEILELRRKVRFLIKACIRSPELLAVANHDLIHKIAPKLDELISKTKIRDDDSFDEPPFIL